MPSEFKAHGGMGVQASVNGTVYFVGKPGWFEQMEVDLSSIRQDIKQSQEQGKTVMMVVADQKPVGLIAVADTIKSESREAVETLQMAIVGSSLGALIALPLSQPFDLLYNIVIHLSRTKTNPPGLVTLTTPVSYNFKTGSHKGCPYAAAAPDLEIDGVGRGGIENGVLVKHAGPFVRGIHPVSDVLALFTCFIEHLTRLAFPRRPRARGRLGQDRHASPLAALLRSIVWSERQICALLDDCQAALCLRVSSLARLSRTLRRNCGSEIERTVSISPSRVVASGARTLRALRSVSFSWSDFGGNVIQTVASRRSAPIRLAPVMSAPCNWTRRI